MTIVAADKTLNQVLAELGYTTEPGDFQGKKKIIKDRDCVLQGAAWQVWDWLKKTNQVSQPNLDRTPKEFSHAVF